MQRFVTGLAFLHRPYVFILGHSRSGLQCCPTEEALEGHKNASCKWCLSRKENNKGAKMKDLLEEKLAKSEADIRRRAIKVSTIV